MPCYKPLRGWLSRSVNHKTGKRSVVFKRSSGLDDREVIVPCGKCLGCRLDRSKQWAVRCLHESSMYDDNCFITLTFDSEKLSAIDSDLSLKWFKSWRCLDISHAYTLVKSDFQRFMKRLRKKFPGRDIRYFHCGEYGSKLDRPHHHACLFNFDFPDKYLWSIRDNVRLYRSDILERLWPFGFCTIGEVNFASAAYVARYILKKQGDCDAEHYKGRLPEYVTMSRRPGIGFSWYNKFSSDVRCGDKVVVGNSDIVRVPSYYDKLYDLTNYKESCKLKRIRRLKAIERRPDNQEKVLARRGLHKTVLLDSLLRRSYET